MGERRPLLGDTQLIPRFYQMFSKLGWCLFLPHHENDRIGTKLPHPGTVLKFMFISLVHRFWGIRFCSVFPKIYIKFI